MEFDRNTDRILIETDRKSRLSNFGYTVYFKTNKLQQIFLRMTEFEIYVYYVVGIILRRFLVELKQFKWLMYVNEMKFLRICGRWAKKLIARRDL